MEFQKERSNFHYLIASNPNYFGNLVSTQFQPVIKVVSDTTYEEVTCIGFNPSTNALEAVVQIKQPSGYNGNVCQGGSFEYVRFFLDYGSGWEDAGYAAINVHDIADQNDCAQQAEKPLSYTASVTIKPKAAFCTKPVLPLARAILSWESVPTDANYVPIWGNHLDRHIQLAPRYILLSELAPNISEVIQPVIPEHALQSALQTPIPLPDPAPFKIEDLAKLYAASPNSAATVPSHRFGFAQLQHAVSGAGAASSEAIVTNIANWKAAGLDWQSAINAIGDLKADTSFEQLECLGMEGADGLERLVATFRIKRPTGYNGALCTNGSSEFVGFWADWDNTCQYSYLGTVKVQVHDIASIPADGLSYNAVLPVDVSHHRDVCGKPKIARVRAVLSWATPPSTTDPNALTVWGNLIDTHVQIRPGAIPNPLMPNFSILGGIPVSKIDPASGLTTPDAYFSLSNLPADSLGRACPFGGRVTVQGPEFPGYKYRVSVQPSAGGAVTTLVTPLWLTRADGTNYFSSPDGAGYFQYQQYPDNIDNLLAVWDTSGDDKWTVTIEIADLAGNPIPGAVPFSYVIQLDNTAPTASIDITSGANCGRFAVNTNISGVFTATDTNFGSFSIFTLPTSLSPAPASGTAPVAGGSWSLNTGTQPCGYVIEIDVSDRSILNSAPGVHNWASASRGFCVLDKV